MYQSSPERTINGWHHIGRSHQVVWSQSTPSSFQYFHSWKWCNSMFMAYFSCFISFSFPFPFLVFPFRFPLFTWFIISDIWIALLCQPEVAERYWFAFVLFSVKRLSQRTSEDKATNLGTWKNEFTLCEILRVAKLKYVFMMID